MIQQRMGNRFPPTTQGGRYVRALETEDLGGRLEITSPTMRTDSFGRPAVFTEQSSCRSILTLHRLSPEMATEHVLEVRSQHFVAPVDPRGTVSDGEQLPLLEPSKRRLTSCRAEKLIAQLSRQDAKDARPNHQVVLRGW